MAEWTSVAVQTVNPGEAIVFTENPVPCYRGLILHRDDSGLFLIKGTSNGIIRRCPCMGQPSINYMVDFGANIAIPTGETVGPISVAYELEGATLGGTTMTVTPAAVEEFFNVSRATNVPIWVGCCESFAVRNISSIPILVQNANLVIVR
jgi:hypothetical protein